jgi:phosphate starvation-inducible PhoH-like protein
VEGIGTIRFSTADVVRHPIVGRIVEAYEGKETQPILPREEGIGPE